MLSVDVLCRIGIISQKLSYHIQVWIWEIKDDQFVSRNVSFLYINRLQSSSLVVSLLSSCVIYC